MADNQPGSPLDGMLVGAGTLGAFQAKAIKEAIAWQLGEAMRVRKLSKSRLATLMKTSRPQVDRLLDPHEGNVTLETLRRAAEIVGLRVQVELI